ncbi:GGDEF domain-containing protein [Uliginosibacterium paludis]|uniref:diguanylate cyclase n=1 Tax=Uliginosibacterium paludis TaxID=1615952 RepID=A0ABV2CRG5_9RHOO
MAEPTSPSEIARETLRRLAMRRIQPTPENFRELYHEISGIAAEDPFPERQLKQIATALPRATPEQLRIARQFEAGLTGWSDFRQQLVASLGAREELPWNALIRDLLQQLERRQQGLNSVVKQEALSRVLESSVDPELLHTRLSGLIKGWAQIPGAMSAPTPLDDEATPPAQAPTAAATTTIPTATDAWRSLLADTLDTAIGMLLIDTPELAGEAKALGNMLRKPEPGTEQAFSERLKQFSYKVQWVAQDQSYIRQALLNLLQLLIENISELVVEDKYLQNQMSVLLELFRKPLDKHSLEELGERLRDVIFKQGTLKRSLTDAQDKLREMLEHFVQRLGELADSTSDYHAKVSVFADRVASASSLPELSGLITEIVRETRQIESKALHSQEELQSLRAAVDQANREIARLETELETASELVRHDPLTGALNRKGLDEMIARELARMQRRKTRLSIALLDVDDFKKLNDTFGHTTGDEALKHLARVIRENIRPQDSSGRYGGEEFLILLPDTGLEDGLSALRRLQRELTRRFFLHDNQKLLITFSAGVAEVMPDDQEVQQVIDRADKAMYRAKKAGKNRVEGG